MSVPGQGLIGTECRGEGILSLGKAGEDFLIDEHLAFPDVLYLLVLGNYLFHVLSIVPIQLTVSFLKARVCVCFPTFRMVTGKYMGDHQSASAALLNLCQT